MKKQHHRWSSIFVFAKCQDCGFEQERRKALALALRHHATTGHSIETTVEQTIHYLSEADHRMRLAERRG